MRRIRDEVEQLESACHAYDQQILSPTVCTNIASISLRKLLHDRPPNSASVLTHLDLKACMRFYDAAVPPLKSDFPVAHCGLAAFGPGGHLPIMDSQVDQADSRLMLSFEEWWTAPVIWDTQGRTFSRSTVVLTAADKDGGGHVDASLPEEFWDLVNKNGLGRFVGVGDSWTELDSPIPACVRHISHEVLVSLAVAVPFAFKSKHHAHAYRAELAAPRPSQGPVISGFAVHGTVMDDGDAL